MILVTLWLQEARSVTRILLTLYSWDVDTIVQRFEIGIIFQINVIKNKRFQPLSKCLELELDSPIVVQHIFQFGFTI